MSDDFAAKIRTINIGTPRKPQTVVADGVKHVEQIHEDTGRSCGRLTYHPDGRVDAVVTPPTTVVKTATTQEH